MGTVTKLNDVLCVNISKVDDILKANASKWDDNTFCDSTPCTPDCCPVELCFNDRRCSVACGCRSPFVAYLSRPCNTDPCGLAYATGIFADEKCTEPAQAGFYSDGSDCYEWDGTSSLTPQGPC
jgi:hypothetical protein